MLVDTVVPTTSCREAEMAKLLENTYRQVNIALVNEMAVFCHVMRIDLWSAIDAAATKPFGFTPFRPGPGVGGHCIPIDPGYLAHQVRALGRTFRFVELAQEINNAMPAFVAHRIQDALNNRALPAKGSKILLVGLTYKADVADHRETPAAALVRDLRRLGADLSGFDPYLDRFRVDGVDLDLASDLAAAVATADIVVVLQHHRVVDPAVYSKAQIVFDTRGVLTGPNVERL
jgi:nucleotide sugar dehydrogenase